MTDWDFCKRRLSLPAECSQPPRPVCAERRYSLSAGFDASYFEGGGCSGNKPAAGGIYRVTSQGGRRSARRSMRHPRRSHQRSYSVVDSCRLRPLVELSLPPAAKTSVPARASMLAIESLATMSHRFRADRLNVWLVTERSSSKGSCMAAPVKVKSVSMPSLCRATGDFIPEKHFTGRASACFDAAPM